MVQYKGLDYVSNLWKILVALCNLYNTTEPVTCKMNEHELNLHLNAW